ncbi:MAG: crossover junction endodeoxyribonuclease RuvC [Oscillospiraceae bacterium]|jgi:crossover junction endodeoxyribonuclease RuvC|nr:crossover junction endodeoxyribonuclease RuvC [Oscillospiraceae bacterium]
MIILGIDPGYAIVGYGVLKYINSRFTVLDYGAVTTPAGMPFPDRLVEIYDSVTALTGKYRPDTMGIEKLFFNTNATTAIEVAEARGVVLLAARKNGISLIGEYTPLQVKMAITGYGQAEKRQVMEMTRLILNLEKIPRPDDAADALAVGVCHAHSVRGF